MRVSSVVLSLSPGTPPNHVFSLLSTSSPLSLSLVPVTARAVYGKHALAAQWLLRNGANQGALDNEQCVPLHWAALKGAVQVMVHMMDEGGRQYLGARDCTGATPAQLAKQKNFHAIHDYLETERAHHVSPWRQVVEYVSCMKLDKGKERFFAYPFWVVAFTTLSAFHYCFYLWSFFPALLPLHVIEALLIATLVISWTVAAFSDAGTLPVHASATARVENKVCFLYSCIACV